MIHCETFLLVLLFFVAKQSQLSLNSDRFYQVDAQKSAQFSFNVHKPMRLTVIQLQGNAQIFITNSNQYTIAKTTQAIFQLVLKDQHLDSNISVTIKALYQAQGLIRVQPLLNEDLLKQNQQKFIHVRQEQTRIIEFYPKKSVKILIQRFDGILSLTLYQSQSKRQGLAFLQRQEPFEIKKHYDFIQVQACDGCILLIKLKSLTANTRIRFSTMAVRTIFESYPTIVWLKQNQAASFKSLEKYQGKVLRISGDVQIQMSNTQMMPIDNGWLYRTSQSYNQLNKTFTDITITGKQALSNVLLYSWSQKSNRINLVDGLVNTFYLHPGRTYLMNYLNNKGIKSNLLITASSQFLQRLNIKVISKQLNQYYQIRPQFFWNFTFASQNFQLDQSDYNIDIQLSLTGDAGYLNVTSDVKQYISLPLNWPYASVLRFRQYDEYIIQGVTGLIEITIAKCVDCDLRFVFSQKNIENIELAPIHKLSQRITYKMTGRQLFVRVQTNNYAYYRIEVRLINNQTQQSPSLSQAIKYYLAKEDSSKLVLQFQPPLCGNKTCQNVSYFMIEGPDLTLLTSKVYCPSVLFDLDYRSDQASFKQVVPTLEKNNLKVLTQLKSHNYIGIVAKVGAKIISYEAVSTQQIVFYKEFQLPFVFFAIFIAAAVSCSVWLFIKLRKNASKQFQNYDKIYSQSS